MEDIIEKLEGNIFQSSDSIHVATVLSTLKEEYTESKNDTKLKNLEMLTDIYQGAQEIKVLSSLLGVNQKTSANTEEVYKYLNTLETTMRSRENSVFGWDLLDIKKVLELETSDSTTERESAEKLWNKILKNIQKYNKTIVDGDLDYIKSVIRKANNVKVTYTDHKGFRQSKNVSLLAGQFDFRYYIEEENIEYKKITKEYYNLIKNTVNIFDVIDEVPHFKEMINGLVTAHNTLLNTSFKYRTAFSIAKDIIKENSNRVIFDKESEKNSHLWNIMGNKAFPVATGEREMIGILSGIDILLRDRWLKSQDTSHLRFSVKNLLSLSNKSEIRLYTSDDARTIEKNKDTSNTVLVKATEGEDFIVSLDTNYGIANFKKIMEELILPTVQSQGTVLANSLKVESVRNAFGIRGNAITSTFPLGDMRSPVSVDKFQKLVIEFNNLDIKSGIAGKLRNTEDKAVKWKDAFYVYNLIVNNEKYGNKRLTPLFEDYIKEKTSLGYNFVHYSSLLDSGEIDIFDYLKLKDSSLPKEELEAEKKKAEEELINDLLFYTLQKRGILYVRSKANKVTTAQLKVSNPDFIIVSSLTETKESKAKSKELSELFRNIRNSGYIIKFKCD